MPEDFKEADKIKILLWCYRHCCLCEKPCGTNIVIHHIEQEGENLSDIDNAIPLCLDCHGKIGSYNPKHSVGTKYKIKEIKARRDQIYEKHTRHLVPPIHFELNQKRVNSSESHKLPFVGFRLTHFGDSLPVNIRVEAKLVDSGKDLGLVKSKYYNGEVKWNINPRTLFFGGFDIPQEYENKEKNKNLKIEIRVTIIDQYEREHKLLPQCWSYRKGSYWGLEPRSFTEWT